MIKGCKHKLALICKQNLNALVFFLLNEVNVRFHFMMGTIVLNRKLLSFVITTTLLIRKKAWRSPMWRAFRMEGAGIFTMQRFPRSAHTKEGTFQGAELASNSGDYNADGILWSMQRPEACFYNL